LRAVVPELAKHVELLRGSVKFSFRLDRSGHVTRLKVSSSHIQPVCRADYDSDRSVPRSSRLFRRKSSQSKATTTLCRQWDQHR